MQQIRLISFDMDQTLLDFRKVLFEALQAVAVFLSAPTGLTLTAQDLQERRDRIAQNLSGRAIDMLSLRRLSFEDILRGHPQASQLTTEAMEIFTDIRFGRVYFIPGARDLLKTLFNQVPLAALTNGNSDPKRAGIGHYFDHVLLAESHPFQKPDPRIFQVLFGMARVRDPQHVLHVGDQLETDILGANRAGAQSVWFNPTGQINKTRITPDFEISALHHLPDIL